MQKVALISLGRSVIERCGSLLLSVTGRRIVHRRQPLRLSGGDRFIGRIRWRHIICLNTSPPWRSAVDDSICRPSGIFPNVSCIRTALRSFGLAIVEESRFLPVQYVSLLKVAAPLTSWDAEDSPLVVCSGIVSCTFCLKLVSCMFGAIFSWGRRLVRTEIP